MPQYKSGDYILMAFHVVATLFALGLTLTTMILVLQSNEERTPFHITNTFLSTYESESPLNTYTPVSEPPTLTQINNTFYTCLMNAEVAVDDMYKCKKDSLDGYRFCINNLVDTPFRVKRMMNSIRKILGGYDDESVEVSQLPTWLTSADTPATLQTWLSSDTTRFALKQQLAAQTTSLSIRILEAITAAELMTGIPACFGTVSSASLTDYSPAYDAAAAFDGLWKCTSDVILVEPVHKRAYEKCIPLSAWPAKDVMQTPYTSTLLGSYNKYFLLWIGLWLLTSFAVYTFPGWSSAASENGKPKSFLARAGKGYVTFGFIWNIAAIIIVLVRTFAPADAFDDAPMSIQTSLFALFFTVSATIYFGMEVYELFYLSDRPPELKFKGTSTRASAAFQQKRQSNGRVYQGISAFMDVPPTLTNDVPDEEYAPLVAPVWNDAWFFADALLFLTIVGQSYDVVTADIVVCVFCILAASLSNSALVRLVYEGYVNDNNKPKLAQNQQVLKNVQESAFVIRVMSVIAAVMGLFFNIIIMILVAMRFKANVISFYVAFSLLVPQVGWLILVLVMEYGAMQSHKDFFWSTSLMFAVGVIIRMCFLAWVVSTFNLNYDRTVGLDDSLHKLFAFVNTDSKVTPSYI